MPRPLTRWRIRRSTLKMWDVLGVGMNRLFPWAKSCRLSELLARPISCETLGVDMFSSAVVFRTALVSTMVWTILIRCRASLCTMFLLYGRGVTNRTPCSPMTLLPMPCFRLVYRFGWGKGWVVVVLCLAVSVFGLRGERMSTVA